jgi:hypothetical protein
MSAINVLTKFRKKLGHGSGSRMHASQAQGSEFNPSVLQKKKKKKERKKFSFIGAQKSKMFRNIFN